MKQVRLVGTDLQTSVLGFGCASLMGRLGRAESLRVLQTAHDTGITHFDVARGYGFGEAEKVLGDLLAGKRDEITVATKFGMFPPRQTARLRMAKAVARKLVRLTPKMRRILRRRGEKLGTGGRFTVRDAQNSLETSLRELRTNYVDVLFLHECNPEDLESTGLLEFLEECVKDGKVRYFGIATTPESTQQILRSHEQFTSVIQFKNNALERNIRFLPASVSSAVITHSVFGADGAELKKLHEYITRSAEHAKKWSDAVGEDCSDMSVISSLMLHYAVTANPSGVVLFSSQDERNIQANTASISQDRFSNDQIECFLELVEQELSEINSA